MTGVDILAIEEVATEFAFNWTVLWIAVAIAGVIGLIYTIYQVAQGYYDWVFIPLMTTVFIMAGAMIGTSIVVPFKIPTKYETQYKVTISDEVPMTEFLEKYEIIETEGKIYTVREKN